MTSAAEDFGLNFARSDEQRELARTVRAFLELKCGEADVRRAMETPEGYDREVWKQMAEQLGLQGMAIPEECGGLGFGFAELTVALEETGRALLPGPLLGSAVLAGSVLLLGDDHDARSRHAPGIASGRTIAAVALAEESGRWDADGIHTTARRCGTSWLLNGGKSFVLDGHIADLVLVAARTEAGISLFAVEDASRVSRRALATLDPTRRQARLDFVDTPAEMIGREGGAWPVLSRALDVAATAVAAEQVGGAQRCLDLAVDYAKMRKQFGRPIGSFQAIRHECADLMLEIECARGAAQYAAQTVTAMSDELPAAASLAKAYCSDTYTRAASANIQIHGGIGFTWEHPAHLYFKRAKSSEQLFGDAAHHRRLLADRIGI